MHLKAWQPSSPPRLLPTSRTRDRRDHRPPFPPTQLSLRAGTLPNDPLNLLAVDSSTNRSKGDGDTATWLPPYKAFRCTHVAKQVAVKGKYGLWVTSAEKDAMTRVLATCPTMGLPAQGSAPTVAALPSTAVAPAPQPAPAAAPPAGATSYANCAAVRAAGAAPIHRGDPGYCQQARPRWGRHRLRMRDGMPGP